MLWDRGTWTPEVDDVDAALAKGDLKFTLNGVKLKGSWVLVRTKGWGGSGGDASRSWLLIKHRDEWAGKVDIVEFAPLSVASGGDFADILAQDRPEIWISHRPAQGGETGALFERIIRRALEMKEQGTKTRAGSKGSTGAKAASSRGAGRSKGGKSPGTTRSRGARS
jgi:bifunctional non-homologous end joining protein LigD